jgi:protein-disulfide isomerase
MFKRYGIENKDLLVPVSILIGAVMISSTMLLGSGGPLSLKAKAEAQEPAPAGAKDAASLSKRSYAPSIGTGKLEIVEFSDFQCPFCQKFYNDAYKQIKAKYIDTGKVKLTFRHMPLSFHANAQKAAEAAECANRQGKFEAYHDKLFSASQSDGTGLAAPDLKSYAVCLGLDTAKFNKCLDNSEAAEAVKKDVTAAGSIGISGTPSFVINGKTIVGAQPFSAFDQAIQEALK